MAHQQLWLLRHGEAVPHESKDDFDRELTARGERQSLAAGRGAGAARRSSSRPATRARSSARAGTAALACEPLNVVPEERERARQGLRRRRRARRCSPSTATATRILVVGHNPSFAQVVQDLTGARSSTSRRAASPPSASPAPAAASCSRCCARASWSRSRSAREPAAERLAERGVDDRERHLGAAAAATRRARTRRGCGPCRRAGRARRRSAGSRRRGGSRRWRRRAARR